MKQPTTPLPCPICGRKPHCDAYEIVCHRFGRVDMVAEHIIRVQSKTDLYPVAQWNAYVRRIRARISKENAK